MEFPGDLPGNSHAARQASQTGAEPEKTPELKANPKPKKIVEGRVVKRKQTIGDKLKNVFVDEEENFAESLVRRVVFPKAKDMAMKIVEEILDGVRQSIEEVMFGPDAAGRRRSTSYTGNRVNYTRYSSSATVRRDGNTRPPPYQHESIRRSNKVRDVFVNSREEGDMVLEELDAMIDDIGHVSVGDFYAMVDITPRSTDEEWGWDNLAGARVIRVNPGEFLMKMPAPKAIDG